MWRSPPRSRASAFAFGVEYRNENLFVTIPTWRTRLGSAQGQGGPQLPVVRHYNVKEFYTEALVPVIQDAPGSKDLSLEFGYRYSDYSSTGTVADLQGAGHLGADRRREGPSGLQPCDSLAEHQ